MNVVDMIERFFTEFSADSILFLFIVLFAIREAFEVIDWFCRKLGIETKWGRKNREQEEMLVKHEALLLNLPNQIEKLSQQLSELSLEVKSNREEADRTRIKEIRSKILDFANSIPKRERSIEEVEEIFDLDEEYLTLLEKYGEHNGRTTRAMEVVNQYYDKIRGLE